MTERVKAGAAGREGTVRLEVRRRPARRAAIHALAVTALLLLAPSAARSQKPPASGATSPGAGPVVVVETVKGTFEFETYPNEAPRTVARILELVKKRFYNGLRVHRVVPNFVVQGLDPRGDGWGTGGRRLPDEFSREPYLAGAVGMPNAGEPNTGGCQLFFTHVPTPHLDGHYTWFGRVVAGLDVVQRLEIGDRVERVARE